MNLEGKSPAELAAMKTERNTAMRTVGDEIDEIHAALMAALKRERIAAAPYWYANAFISAFDEEVLMNRRAFLTLMGGLGVAAACGNGDSPKNPASDTSAQLAPIEIPPDGTTDNGSGLFYQRRDQAVIDYRLYNKDGSDFWLRGPDPGPLTDGQYIAFAGAAQTFGTYAPMPFPAEVAKRMEVPALNLGIGGAGPAKFPRHPELMDWLNRSRFVVLQVMSGRSASNSLMQSTKGGRHVEFMGKSMMAEQAWNRALGELSTVDLWRIVDEQRADWVAGYEAVLSQITVPTVLLYISVRTPHRASSEDRGTKPASVVKLFRPFPQLVTREMVDAAKAKAARYVESVNGDGLPQPLYDRATGEQIKTNNYYPSPEMHHAAANRLTPVCREMWG